MILGYSVQWYEWEFICMCVTKAANGLETFMVEFYNSIQLHNWVGLCMSAKSSCTQVIHGSKEVRWRDQDQLWLKKVKLYGVRL